MIIGFGFGTLASCHNQHSGQRTVLQVFNPSDGNFDIYASRWILVTTNHRFLDSPRVAQIEPILQEEDSGVLWTDERVNIVSLICLQDTDCPK